jgi:acylphosphatase
MPRPDPLPVARRLVDDDGDVTKAVDLRITGVVQGVSFRYYARAEATRLGVAGWVRNEPDGTVAGHFEGPGHAVDALVAWCRHGPAYADVQDVAVAPADISGATAFSIR